MPLLHRTPGAQTDTRSHTRGGFPPPPDTFCGEATRRTGVSPSLTMRCARPSGRGCVRGARAAVVHARRLRAAVRRGGVGSPPALWGRRCSAGAPRSSTGSAGGLSVARLLRVLSAPRHRHSLSDAQGPASRSPIRRHQRTGTITGRVPCRVYLKWRLTRPRRFRTVPDGAVYPPVPP